MFSLRSPLSFAMTGMIASIRIYFIAVPKLIDKFNNTAPPRKSETKLPMLALNITPGA
ncbi:hypothetical protein OAO40_05195 [Amylibacter sp.]|nr:hypothetical protein [Amylibacter sp.]